MKHTATIQKKRSEIFIDKTEGEVNKKRQVEEKRKKWRKKKGRGKRREAKDVKKRTQRKGHPLEVPKG